MTTGCRPAGADFLGKLTTMNLPSANDTATAGALFIVSAPSGAGKTTLVRKLMAVDPGIRHSVSYTTRAPRPGEQHGHDYNFVDIQTFLAMRERGEFLEWAEVHGNFYGTSRNWLLDEMRAGRDTLLEIDWQGAQQVRELMPHAVTIFIVPPSIEELERRLRSRGQDSEEVIQRRVAAALSELRHVDEFDFVIINNDLQEALADLAAAVRASRLDFGRQRVRHPEVFRFLSLH
jgi:guanylate kinase